MNLENEDIEAAVVAGVIPQAQADALRAFASERRTWESVTLFT